MARLVVAAPGRGTYNRTELGYLNRFSDHPNFNKRMELAAKADEMRTAMGRESVTALDNATAYNSKNHLPGENASALIFTCAAADYQMIHSDHQVVATLGNSMGWYTTLHTGGALAFEDAFRMVDTMGYFQKGNVQGGQLIYPIIDENWRMDPEKEAEVLQIMNQVASQDPDSWVGLSIRLGGLLVIAGTDKGLKALLKALPKTKIGANEYPFQLMRHSAFHTPLMKEASNHGLYHLSNLGWKAPLIPMVDGKGAIWRQWETTLTRLKEYTLVTQVLEPYDFTASVRVALREYNPDHLVLLGPGETLGGAIAHVMIDEGWRGIRNKKDFQEAQKSDKPPLISMNRPDQAAHVI